MKKLVLTVGLVAFSLFAYDNLDPSQSIPDSLALEQVPMFISLGFDDNRFADGVDWVRDTLFKGRVNPAGKGNRATFDGTPMETGFYVIGNSDIPWSATPFEFEIPDKDNRPATDAWKRAYEAGFAISNHTWTHNYNLYDLNYDTNKGELPSLMEELGFCTKYLVNVAGIPLIDQRGFRTPFLANSVSDNASFRASWELAVLYDCTLDNGMQGNRPATWTVAYWPGTMTNGWGAHKTAPTAGLWQYPNATYQQTEGGVFSVKGFDSGTANGWPKGASAEDMFNQMKWAIEYNYTINRAPIDLGLHSDYYSNDAQNDPAAGASKFTTPLKERQRSLIMLLDWISDSLPDARVVNKIDVINWMRDPVTLDDLSRNAQFTINKSLSTGILAPSAAIQSANSESVLNGKGADVTVADENGNWKLDAYAGTQYDIGEALTSANGLKITYSSTLPLRIVLLDENVGIEKSFSAGLGSTDGTERTVELPVSKYFFEQPRPFTTVEKLNLANIHKIAIVAEVFDTTLTGSFTADLELYGMGKVSSISPSINPTHGFFANVNKGGLQLSVPVVGKYELTLVDMRGRVVYRNTLDLSRGENAIHLNKSIAHNVLILNLNGMGRAFTKSIILK